MSPIYPARGIGQETQAAERVSDYLAILIDLLMQRIDHRIDECEIRLIGSLALEIHADPELCLQVSKKTLGSLLRAIASNVTSNRRSSARNLSVTAQIGLDEKESSTTSSLQLHAMNLFAIVTHEQRDCVDLVFADLGRVTKHDRTVRSDSRLVRFGIDRRAEPSPLDRQEKDRCRAVARNEFRSRNRSRSNLLPLGSRSLSDSLGFRLAHTTLHLDHNGSRIDLAPFDLGSEKRIRSREKRRKIHD